jgi:hypothetical protein
MLPPSRLYVKQEPGELSARIACQRVEKLVVDRVAQHPFIQVVQPGAKLRIVAMDCKSMLQHFLRPVISQVEKALVEVVCSGESRVTCSDIDRDQARRTAVSAGICASASS